MEIGVLDVLMFAAAFALLFFVPGHFLLRKRPVEEKFIASTAISFLGMLVLSETIGLDATTLLVFVAVATIILSYLSASL